MLKKIKNPAKKLFLQRVRRNRFVIKTHNKTKRPRLSVFKSCKHLYVQIIDDVNSKTLVATSTLNAEVVKLLNKKDANNMQSAQLIGKIIAEKAIKANVNEVVFDRGGYVFHGKIKAIADAARENGLKF